ncbi:exonuclease domain-containing protein [Lentzea sp. NPDC006480]|uniref:3'-5' exonuclease n=1 Tax=Lentzea sp. NPDC006480 TaxID=3157176 RepID=UPI0033A14B48
MSNGYAVVDVETTGLGDHHRVVEVAIVHVDASGRRTDEWCTLVNPRRDLGARLGITAADIQRAPDFAGVAGELAARLSGRVLVAHNLPFHLVFLRAEFALLGHEFPASGVCTMELGGGITRAYSALRNARASARLLVSCLDRVGDVSPVRLEVPRLLRTYAMQRSSTGGRA